MPVARRQTTQESPVVVNVGTQPQETPPAPAPPEEKPENWFFDKITAIPSELWAKENILELHRLEPKLPGVPGSKGFIDVFTEPVTKTLIKSRYGGGKFRLILLKNSKYQTCHDFDIMGDPIYARGREIPPNGDGPAGNLEGRLLNMLETNLKEMKEEVRRREANGQPDTAFEKSVDLLNTAYTTAIHNVQREPASPTALLKDLVETAQKLGMFTSGNGGGGNILETIKVLKELGVLGGGAQQNPLEQLNLFLGIFEKIDALRGEAGGGRRGDWKQVLAERAAEHLPQIITAIGAPGRAPRAVAPQRPQIPPAAAQPQAPPAPVAVQQVQPAQRRMPAPAVPSGPLRVVPAEEGSVAPANAQAEEQPATSAVEVITDEEFYIAGVKRRVVQLVRNGDVDGTMVVDFLEMAWPQAVNYLEAFPAEEVTKFFSQDPILAAAVEMPHWQRVLQEAQAYLHEDLPANVPVAAN